MNKKNLVLTAVCITLLCVSFGGRFIPMEGFTIKNANRHRAARVFFAVYTYMYDIHDACVLFVVVAVFQGTSASPPP